MASTRVPQPNSRPPIVGLVGPTGAGKSQLALKLALKLPGEIIAADSRTVYRGLTIGTAKPTAADRCRVRHHLLDVVGPGDSFSVAQFQALGRTALAEIVRRGLSALVVGGSGLYVDSLLWGYQFTDGPPDQSQRRELGRLNISQLQQMIGQKGLTRPENWQNKRYLVRTLERDQSTSIPPQLLPGVAIVGLNLPQKVLRDNLQRRWESMLSAGVVNEARWAWQHYPPESEALKSNVYRSLQPHLTGQISLAEAGVDFLRRDWQLARRQLTWWRRRKEIKWFADSGSAFQYLISLPKPTNAH